MTRVGVAQGEVVLPLRQLNSIAKFQTWVREHPAKSPADEWVRLPRVVYSH